MSENDALPYKATVHPTTVTAVSRRILDGESASPAAPRRARSEPRNGVVENRTAAHPKVWAMALKAANGDARRIKVHSWTRVEILD